MKFFIVGIVSLFAAHTFATQNITSSINQSFQAAYCQTQSFGQGDAQGYGSDYANCERARNSAASAAKFGCHAAGHSACEVIRVSIVSVGYNFCRAEAIARASLKSICRPEHTFIRHGWAGNYGSEYQNCQVSKRSSSNAALNDCYRSGFRRCNIMNEHVYRVQSNIRCETSSVVRGQY